MDADAQYVPESEFELQKFADTAGLPGDSLFGLTDDGESMETSFHVDRHGISIPGPLVWLDQERWCTTGGPASSLIAMELHLRRGSLQRRSWMPAAVLV